MGPGMFPTPFLVQHDGVSGSGSSPALATSFAPPSNRYKRPLQPDELIQGGQNLSRRMTNSSESNMERAEERYVKAQQTLLGVNAENNTQRLFIQNFPDEAPAVEDASHRLAQSDLRSLQYVQIIQSQEKVILEHSQEIEVQRQLILSQKRVVEQFEIRHQEHKQLFQEKDKVIQEKDKAIQEKSVLLDLHRQLEECRKRDIARSKIAYSKLMQRKEHLRMQLAGTLHQVEELRGRIAELEEEEEEEEQDSDPSVQILEMADEDSVSSFPSV